MWKFLANLLLAGLAIGLTIFTGSRTLDLLSQWLPANQQIMQYLGLAAFEGGLYFWSFYFVTAAKGVVQRGIAVLMIVVCFISVAVATVADLLLVGAESGKLPDIPTTQKQAIVVFVGVVIVLNVAAFLAAKLTHPDKLKEMAIQDAEDQIHAMELAMIRRTAPSVAVQMAPLKTEQWVQDAWSRMLPYTARPAGNMIESSVSSVPTLPVGQTPQVLAQTGSVPVPPGNILAQGKSGGVWQRVKGLFPGKSEALPVYNTPAQIPQDQLNEDFKHMQAEERARKRVTNVPASRSTPAAMRQAQQVARFNRMVIEPILQGGLDPAPVPTPAPKTKPFMAQVSKPAAPAPAPASGAAQARRDLRRRKRARKQRKP